MFIYISITFLYPRITCMHISLPLLVIFAILDFMKEKREPAYYIPLFSLFMVWCAICIVFGAGQSQQAVDAVYGMVRLFIIPFILVVIVYNSKMSNRDLDLVLKSFCFIAAINGIINVAMALRNPTERIGAFWGTAMTINGYYLLSFFLSIAFVLKEEKKIQKIVYASCALLIVLGILFTYTRMALLGVFFGFFILILKVKKLRKIALFVSIIIILAIPSSMTKRINEGVEGDSSTLVRTMAWYNSAILIQKHPITGIGFNTLSHIYKSILPVRSLYAEHSHNLYIRIMLETGVFGFIIFFSLMLSIMYRSYKILVRAGPLREFYFVIFVAVISLLFACLTDVFIIDHYVGFEFWFLLAFLYKMAMDYKKGIQEMNAEE